MRVGHVPTQATQQEKEMLLRKPQPQGAGETEQAETAGIPDWELVRVDIQRHPFWKEAQPKVPVDGKDEGRI